jgi:pimeloyl-ACP methyl ester carboxylesterase
VLRRLRNFASVIACISLLLVLAGLFYQEIKQRGDARRFPEVGRLVSGDGVRLNINCTGQGSPTVVLEAGLAMFSTSWQQVQQGIAKFTRVCSYDRAGYAWSDSSPLPRTSSQIAKELHSLLANAGEKPPYILVGHSFGGLSVRAYNGLYSSDVAGVVLVESTHPDLLNRLPLSIKVASDNAQSQRERQVLFAPLMWRLGIARLMARRQIDDSHEEFSDRENAYLSLQPKFIDAVTRESGSLNESNNEVRTSGTLGDKPLIVLTAGQGFLGIPVQGKDLEDIRGIWINELQVQLVQLSSQGKRIMVQDSDHMIPQERPDVIVSAVNEIYMKVKSK